MFLGPWSPHTSIFKELIRKYYYSECESKPLFITSKILSTCKTSANPKDTKPEMFSFVNAHLIYD